jgi:thioredoxin
MKIKALPFLLLSLILISCNGQQSKNIENNTPEAFAKAISETPNAQILDVRTPEEFESGHIDNAVNGNWLGANFTNEVAQLDKTKPLFVYCKTGNRSTKAAMKLAELGFTNIHQLEGGILKWDAAGLSKPNNTLIGMSSQEYETLINTNQKVLVSFYAEWCAPCKKMTPYMLQLQKDMANKLVIVRLDADKNKTLITAMQIDELPTLILYENKEVKWKHTGFISEEDLKKQLQ